MSPNGYLLLADTVLVAHSLFALFVLVSLVLILIGGPCQWRWVRNRAFRLIHVGAIGIVVMQAWLGIVCPLTSLEMWLRSGAGDTVYTGSFIAHWLHALLYYQAPTWVFAVAYSLFGALVVASWIWVRPHPSRSGRDDRRATVETNLPPMENMNRARMRKTRA